jgi:DNA mismatch endonuclease (patch repair protein)
MPDIFSKAKRSEVMSRIRSRGNRDTEERLAQLMRAAGVKGWRRQVALWLEARAAGRGISKTRSKVRPDFVFRSSCVAVFVDRCFWHGCPRHCRMPTSNRAFWEGKITGNIARDRRVTRQLRKQGWAVLRIRECALSRARLAGTIARLKRALWQ